MSGGKHGHDHGGNSQEAEDAFANDDAMTEEEMNINFDSFYENLDHQGQRTDIAPEISRDLTMLSVTGPTNGLPGSIQMNNPIESRSHMLNTVTVDLEFFDAAAAALGRHIRSNNTRSGFNDFAVPNSPLGSSFGSGHGSGPQYANLGEDSQSLRWSQDSYSGMNIDSPAGSQPQSFASLPNQGSSSQLSQNSRYGDLDNDRNVPTNSLVQEMQNFVQLSGHSYSQESDMSM